MAITFNRQLLYSHLHAPMEDEVWNTQHQIKHTIEELERVSKMIDVVEDGTYDSVKEYAWDYTNGHCFYCGKSLYYLNKVYYASRETRYTYLIPHKFGGLYVMGNIAVTCEACDKQKRELDGKQLSADEYCEKQKALKTIVDSKEFMKPLFDLNKTLNQLKK